MSDTPQTTTPGAHLCEQRRQLHDRVENDLVNHAPQSEVVHEALDSVTEACLAASHALIDAVPPGRFLSMALTSIHEASMAAKAGIATNQDAVEVLAEAAGD